MPPSWCLLVEVAGSFFSDESFAKWFSGTDRACKSEVLGTAGQAAGVQGPQPSIHCASFFRPHLENGGQTVSYCGRLAQEHPAGLSW